MAEHTPGPWRVEGRSGTVYEFDIVGPNGEDLGYVNHSDGCDEPTLYPVAANARLIAAAPELLAALKVLTQDSRFNVAIGGNPSAVDALVKQVDTAIAKAEGVAGANPAPR